MAETTERPPLDPDAVNLFTEEFARCPQAAYAELRAKCPVSRMALSHAPIVSRHDDVIYALRHPEIFSSAMDMQMGLGTQRPMIPQQVDPPAQTRYRRLLDPHFSRRKMEALARAGDLQGFLEHLQETGGGPFP